MKKRNGRSVRILTTVFAAMAMFTAFAAVGASADEAYESNCSVGENSINSVADANDEAGVLEGFIEIWRHII